MLAHAAIAIAFCRYLAIAILVRGPGLSGATVLLAILPLVATFAGGVRAGLVWGIVSLAAGVNARVARTRARAVSARP